MISNDTEIEIKVKIENAKPLISFLERNAKFKKEEKQFDEYFTPIHRNFVSIRPVKEWLRLRNENGKYSINYKNWNCNKDGKAYSCDEFETHVEDLDTVKKLFTALDIKPLVKVDKIRKTWNYKNYEISIDTVIGLGVFVEIEFKGESSNHKKVTDDMIEFLKKLGVGKIQRDYQGYSFSILFPNEVEYQNE